MNAFGAIGVAVALIAAIWLVGNAGGFAGLGGDVAGALPATVATAIAQAIGQQEGFGVAGARPTRNNNPGDLRNWPPGYPTDDAGFTIFPNAETGWAALEQDIQEHAAGNPGQSLQTWIGEYAPASDGNDPIGYAASVAAAVGATPETTFQELAVPA